MDKVTVARDCQQGTYYFTADWLGKGIQDAWNNRYEDKGDWGAADSGQNKNKKICMSCRMLPDGVRNDEVYLHSTWRIWGSSRGVSSNKIISETMGATDFWPCARLS